MGFMLIICKYVLGCGRVSVLHKVIFYMEARVLYSGAIISWQQHWPKNVPGDDINKHFENKELGYLEIMLTKMDEVKP